jgi:hypothetical protein
VIGGYIPNGDALDSILVEYCEGRDLMCAASVRAGFWQDFRRVVLPHFEDPESHAAHSQGCQSMLRVVGGKGMTAAKMAAWRWLDPFIVARIECLKRTPDNRLRLHASPVFAAIKTPAASWRIIRVN